MKEQLVTQKVGNRSGMANKRRSGVMAQRPARRDRGNQGDGVAARFRTLLSYVPAILKLVLAVIVGLLLFTGYRAAASAGFFQIRNIEVQGTSRASAAEIQMVVRREIVKHGVWRADLADLVTRLDHLPWVRTAIVSRVLPDGVRVRITERVPRAVVRMSSGRFRWVDDDAVTLGEMSPTDPMPSFFLRGWNEEESESARKENVERVRRFLEIERDWAALGLSERVSEVNLFDLSDVRAQLAGADSQIEVRLGGEDFSVRLKKALELLDQQRNTPLGPYITYIIMNQRNPIVGHSVAVRPTVINQTGTDVPKDSNAGDINQTSSPDSKSKRASKVKKERT